MNIKKVLLVEDNPDEEELALIAFKKAGVDAKDIQIVRDGQEAIDYLFAREEFLNIDVTTKPLVIFLDLNIPKTHGLEVLKIIKQNEQTVTIPVVILTSSDDQKDIQEGYKFGANSYICKPFDFRIFVANIKNMANYWLDLNKTPS